MFILLRRVVCMSHDLSDLFFFLDHTASPVIYTLSLHDALPISFHVPRSAAWLHAGTPRAARAVPGGQVAGRSRQHLDAADRKSTRLNSSHVEISYAVFCLKKKKPFQLPR